MTKQRNLSHEDMSLFRSSVKGAKTLKQDTVVFSSKTKTMLQSPKKLTVEQENETFYFSDEYQPMIKYDPVRYLRPLADPYQLKKLSRGTYYPDFFLDLHGLTQAEAKKELGSLIAASRKEFVHCSSIMYGHGKNILKTQIPLWLAQHPYVIAFHQAPKEFGGSAALLVLIELASE